MRLEVEQPEGDTTPVTGDSGPVSPGAANVPMPDLESASTVAAVVSAT